MKSVLLVGAGLQRFAALISGLASLQTSALVAYCSYTADLPCDR